MKVLIVCSGNEPNFNVEIHQAFVFEQVNAICTYFPEISCDYFFIFGKGVIGYLSNLNRLKKKIKENKYDIIHAHFALTGLLAVLQRDVPVICTFHGSDITLLKNRILSSFVTILSHKVIFVSNNLFQHAIFKKNKDIIPCGVNFDIFKPMEKIIARQKMNFDLNKQYILFSSSFDVKIKNYKLFKKAYDLLNDKDIEIIELKGYSREKVAILMNAVDICVMTSFSEGSPQFIKEAMVCNCPIVSTDVGDVRWVINNVEGCYLTSFKAEDVAEKIKLALNFSKQNSKTNGRERIIDLKLDVENITYRIFEIYKKVHHKSEKKCVVSAV